MNKLTEHGSVMWRAGSDINIIKVHFILLNLSAVFRRSPMVGGRSPILGESSLRGRSPRMCRSIPRLWGRKPQTGWKKPQAELKKQPPILELPLPSSLPLHMEEATGWVEEAPSWPHNPRLDRKSLRLGRRSSMLGRRNPGLDGQSLRGRNTGLSERTHRQTTSLHFLLYILHISMNQNSHLCWKQNKNL